MKKILLIFICFLALRCIAQEYVDLGLPSGTLWKSKNESGHYTYKEAVNYFGNKLPTKEQIWELGILCTWIWNGKGYNVIGPSGKFIVLPASGFLNRDNSVKSINECCAYWSSTPRKGYYGDCAWSIYFCKERLATCIGDYYQANAFCVRLVKEGGKVESSYIDLGLPSGTLWKDRNESAGVDGAKNNGFCSLYNSYSCRFFNYDEAKQFGTNLPTIDQFEELRKSCIWTWNGGGYEVVGPNGNSIFLPAAGDLRCDGITETGIGESGAYISSTITPRDAVMTFHFTSSYIFTLHNAQCGHYCVRLVQNP